MKKILLTKVLLILLTSFLFVYQSNAQMHVNHCVPIGGTGSDNSFHFKVDASLNKYSIYETNSTDFPITSGAVQGNTDLVFRKENAAHQTVFSIRFGGDSTDYVFDMQMLNNRIYILGQTYSTNFPVTDGSNHKGGTDAFLRVYDLNGSLIFSKLLGGGGIDQLTKLAIDDNDIYAVGHTTSANITTTNSSTYSGGNDVLYYRLNASGTVTFSSYIGGTSNDQPDFVSLYQDTLLIGGYTNSSNFPVTTSDTIQGAQDAFLYMANNANVKYYANFFGGNGFEIWRDIEVENGIIYFNLQTSSTNLPISNNNPATGYYFGKINLKGTPLFASYFSYNNITGQKLQDLKVENGKMYLLAGANTAGLLTTNGSTYGGGAADVYYMVLSTNNIIEFATYIGGSGREEPQYLERFNNKSYIISYSANPSLFPVAGGGIAVANAITDADAVNSFAFALSIIEGTTLKFSSMLPINSNSRVYNFYATDEKFFINLNVSDYTTYYTVPWNNFDQVRNDASAIMELVMCKKMSLTNTLTPSTQTKCKQGLADLIVGNEALFSSDSFPKLYSRAMTSTVDEEYKQTGGTPKYQWQISSTSTGPWSDISAGILRDYLPSIGNSDQYYRRIVKGLSFCTTGDTSAVVSVLVNSFTAPTVNAGGIVRTCPNVSIGIGGSPTATGGGGTYTYLWDQSAYLDRDNIANPTATVAINTVFEVTVTDNNGCKQIDQVVVMAHQADAGPDKGACSGVATQIGSLPIAGLSGVSYSWNNTGSLSSGSVAQPMSNPGSVTTYTLTMTIPKTGGGTCATTDQVQVTPVSITAGFAGSDRVICRGSTTTLGATAQSGFTYTWAPGNYLTSNNASTTTFDAGSFFPSPNPFTYFVTAAKSGCIYIDDVQVAVLESNGAGVDGCGPRIVGISDLTPNINDTYTWVRVSGTNGNFSPSATTNTPTSTVTATSPSGSTTYQVTIAYNGTSCVDQVVVPQCGCVLSIEASGPVGCPKFSSGQVTLTATGASISSSDPNAYTYNWSPSAGLSSATGRSVTLTDNVQRTYTVTVTSPYDGGFNCQASIAVNNPAWSVPTFTAKKDTVCGGTTVNIGQTSVGGYSYLWSGDAGISNTAISNPSVTPTSTGTYFVKVTDVGSGCYAFDTAKIVVRNVVADAGPDWFVCQNGLIELGSTGLANHSYYWLPSATWQNSTTQTSAKPQVRVSTNIQFDVRVTDNATGCIKRDTVQVTVSNTPTIANAPNVTICKDIGRTIGSPALPGVTYSWTPTTGLSCSNCAQPVATPSSTTTYTCTATFLGNCSSSPTDQVVVTVSDPSFTMSDVAYCPSSGATNIGADAPSSGISTYSWTPVDKVSNAAIANPTTNVSQNTLFTLTVTNSAGCTASATKTVGPSNLPPNAGADRQTCVGTTITIGDPNNIGSLTWTPSTGLSSTSAAAPTFTTNTVGTYTKILTQVINSGKSNCTVIDTMVITVTDFNLPTLPTATNICQGACTEIGFSPTMGVDYIWSPSTGLSSTTTSITTACLNATTEYTLTAINSMGCVVQRTTSVAVSPVAAPTVTIPNLILCLGSSGDTLRPVISPSGTYTYSWTPPYALSNVNVLKPKVTPITSGSTVYTMSATNTSNGCSGFGTATVDVTNCTPLPVTLITYTAKWNNDQGLINWKTASEQNNSHFELLRAFDNGNFQHLSFINSLAVGGNSQKMLNYNYIDTELSGRTFKNVYYKLVQYDFNGALENHGIVNLKKGTLINELEVTLFPNPTNQKVTVNASGFTYGNIDVTITDLMGKTVLEKRVVNTSTVAETFDLEILNDGMYIIKLSDGMQSISKKIVLVK